MPFKIDWVTFAIALAVFLAIYHISKITGSYLKLRNTRLKVKALDQQLKNINEQIEAKKAEIKRNIQKQRETKE